MMYGHFTLYNRTVVREPAKIIIAQNVFCDEYVGGNGVEPWDALDDSHMTAYSCNQFICDMFVTLVPQMSTDKEVYNWRSLTGRMPSSLNVSQDVADRMWYPGCTAVSSYWKFQTDVGSYGSSTKKPYQAYVPRAETRKQNVICMQELQLRWDPHKRDFLDLIEDCGHWGSNVYPGCGLVRNGQKTYFDVPFYKPTKQMSLVR
jgi:hypothetical protein